MLSEGITMDLSNMLVVLAIMTGVSGGFPVPPMMITKVLNNTMIKWLLVFILLFRGGSGNLLVSTIAVLTIYLLYKFITYIEEDDSDLVIS